MKVCSRFGTDVTFALDIPLGGKQGWEELYTQVWNSGAALQNAWVPRLVVFEVAALKTVI
jgi:hypothetical protein